jgi:hypothetical protein
MKKYIIIFFVAGLIGCVSQKDITEYKKISQKEFLEEPFGFKESIENFSNNSDAKFKTQKLLRKNKHYPEKTDTIYQLTYKKSEIFFYKTYMGKEFLLTGNILNRQIELKNGIRVGITQDEFIQRFSNKLELNKDSLMMIGEGTKYTFIFDNEKLCRINIDNYFD